MDNDEVSRRLNNPERIGLGVAQLVPFFIASFVLVCDGQEMLVMSFVDVHLKRIWGLTPAMEGMLGACVFAGILVGSLVSGIFADAVGRRPTILAFFSLVLVAGLASAMSPSFAWLLLLRSLTGIGVGGSMPTCSTLIAEVFPDNSRGVGMLLLSTGFIIGECITALEAMYIDMTGSRQSSALGIDGWRFLLGLSAAPALIGVLLAWCGLRESPRFLKTRGRIVEMHAELDWMEDTNRKGRGRFCCGNSANRGESGANENAKGASEEGSATPLLVKKVEDGKEIKGDEPAELLSVASLMGKLVNALGWKEAVSMWWVWLIVSVVYYGVVWILPTTLNEETANGLAANATLLHANQSRSGVEKQRQHEMSLKVLVSALAELPSVIIPVFLVNSLGRKNLLNLAMGLCIVFSGICAWSVPSLDVSDPSTKALAKQGLASVFLTFVMVLKCTIAIAFSVIYIYTAEAVQTEVRGTAIGVGSAMSRLGGIATPIVTSTLHNVSIAAPYWFFLAASLSGLAAGLCLRGVSGRAT